ncbi:TonB-dependent receptor [Pedobacter sp. MC2016-24]|uniref:SusC/RagA family TonB-linked outer membrane protein n=1 Tax=Pedobacter sp. MC2016-24 TaxID=2780090 RepID=UPI0018825E59|nr:TonB-dependent receptor [Pedobacter sp. MC2016-24]MBE9601087.1 TonB-dependent receptor [Pedobacter sp. MC2016-24]
MKHFYWFYRCFRVPQKLCVLHTLSCLIIISLTLFNTPDASAQAGGKKTITGKVTDAMGLPLPGVIVATTSGPKLGTQTDNNGRFVLDVEPGVVLRFSYVGYIEQKVTVTLTTNVIDIKLLESAIQADEVVITAMGQKQRKEAIVGAVSTIRPGDLKVPASNLTGAMAGKISGVIAFQPSGQPGQDNSNFFIRGVTTFGYRREPLILIDNVEMTSSDLARLQVDDIESFSILKDASATALYGARGGNGVILVKTKEGKPGKAQINFRLEGSASEAIKSLEIADPITYMKLYNEALTTRNSPGALYTPNKIMNTLASMNGAPGSNPYVYPAVNWMDMLFKKRTTTERANLNISGGGGVARYYIAGSYSNDNGILKTDIRNNNNNNVSFKNYQLRSNINIDLTNTTELVVRLSGNFNEYVGPMTNDPSFATDLYNIATHTSPVDFPAYYEPDAANAGVQHILFGNNTSATVLPDGTTPPSSSTDVKNINPYAALLRGNRRFSESRMLAQLELNQKLDFLTKGLNFKGIFSTNRYARFESQLAYAPYFYNVQSYDKASNQYTLNWINNKPDQAREYLNYYAGESTLNTFLYLQGVIDYSADLGENHNVSAALIGTQQQQLNANAKTLFNSLPFRNLGLSGRATYSYKSRYFLEANFGYNGSERFSENHRFGFFPTIGASWIVSGEKFYGNLANVIDRMKLRASYGLVGNDAISDRRFFYLSDVNLNGGNPASFGTNLEYSHNGVSINNYENRDVTWEVSRQINLGLELTLLKNFRFTTEVYKNYKSDILQERKDIPSTMGLESKISANIGKVESQGIEFSLDGKHNFTRDFWVSSIANFTLAKNKYTQYEEPDFDEKYRLHNGVSLNRNFGYIAERLFVDDNEAKNSPKQIFSNNGIAPMGGDIKYRDLNGDGVIDGKDQTWFGNPTVPEIVYGFGLSTGYKNFDFNVFFQGQTGVSFVIDPGRTSPFIKSPDAWLTGNTQVIQQFADDHWSEDNQNLYALYPRLGINGAVIENNRQNSSWWLRDGSFLRMKSLEVGYTLPRRLANKIKLKNLRVYFSGLNLITWSPFTMWDPEIGGNGFSYPLQKVYNIGVNISL